MAQLAKACINRDPKRRPTMRSVVVSANSKLKVGPWDLGESMGLLVPRHEGTR
ncbi:hypothetical protein A2U01_0069100 [Trifolium medium]|uniref:Receptor-like protein kinase n=1 Tax=Trifolium medium TaxID=97028 RepID=A0A392SG40_9FABA|nr:hypothetical protein [Trifolium medium]